MYEEIGRRGGSRNIRDPRIVSGETADRNSHEIYEFGPFRLEPSEHKLARGSEVVTLTPKVFDMLVMLVRNNGHLLEKDELIRSLWPDSFVEEGSLSNNISVLRKALGNDHEYIETVPRRGYRFVGAVRQLPDAEKPPNEPWASEDEVLADRRPAGPITLGASSASAAPSRRSSIKSGWALVWLIGGLVVILLASGYWYLSRPLPPPRVTAYTQITHDGHAKQLIGTDGSRLYFNQNYNFIAQVGVNGGPIAQLPIVIPGASTFLSDISPDGANALVGTLELGRPVSEWIAPVLGGPAKRLAEGNPGKFSPDGGSVIFSTADGDIYVVRTDGTGKHKLAHTDRPPSYSVGHPMERLSDSTMANCFGKCPQTVLEFIACFPIGRNLELNGLACGRPTEVFFSSICTTPIRGTSCGHWMNGAGSSGRDLPGQPGSHQVRSNGDDPFQAGTEPKSSWEGFFRLAN
jgi:DNA-binding winged helix-turn-helix (wHTH) protein